MSARLKPALQYSQGRFPAWSGAKLVNMFSEISEGDKAELYAVMAIPGLDLFCSINSLPLRGMHFMRGVLYAVCGTQLYRIDSDGAFLFLGIIAGVDPVIMVNNGSQLAIQASSAGYVLDSNVLYSSITNLPLVSGLVYVDGYFIWSIADSDQFIISAINDGLSYDPLDVATVEGDPDNIVGIINDHREIHFYGTKTIEIWYNSGAGDFPFARQGNAFIERGCIDRDSIVKIDNSVHFVGDDRVVYRLNGYEPQRISTHAIEYEISKAKWFRAFTYTLLGHKHYVLSTDLGTFAFDIATGSWHERKSTGLLNYRINGAVNAYGKILASDAYTGRIYVFNEDNNTENGEAIICEIQLPSIETDRNYQTLYSIEAKIQAGVGSIAQPDPKMILSYSTDGGQAYSADIYRDMGKNGDYTARCIWRLGVIFRQLQIHFKLPSPVKRMVISYTADIR